MDLNTWTLEEISSIATQQEVELYLEGSSRLGAKRILAWTSL